ncbi:type IV pilus modification PilV family protein [Vibrio algivorus]|uniref:MSHA biogenesis protein MshD n=1 Tax=Vibrio algivorus TaxID=1667024 RepID=A0ABQ6EPL2_9VIBR|nr:prepilin-type N-terminal cleavage/methylation domain-containing protein [Vibrio algivorus]GLT15063.1 MSHA biogenesis protein MshD [Vibrio algivorus]
MNNKNNRNAHQRGFTLIESIVAMVVMGIAMTILFSIFFPRVEDSGRPQYIVRASALGQSVMNTILSRGFDDNSDPSGSRIRCDDEGNPDAVDVEIQECSSALGPEEETANAFNDVDDYIGCWYAADVQCTESNSYPLSDLINNSNQYPHFKVMVDVMNINNNGTESFTDSKHTMKKVTLTVSSQNYESVKFVGYKGNY